MRARNEICVLALPAQTRRLRQRLFHHGRGVDEDFNVAAGLVDQHARERFEPRLDQIVIIVAQRIDRDGAAQALVQDRERIVMRAVIDAEHDDRAHARPQRARIGAAVGVARHPIHVAVAAGFEECAEPRGRARDGVGPRHAEGVEAMRAGRFGERALGRGRRQKSRLP